MKNAMARVPRLVGLMLGWVAASSPGAWAIEQQSMKIRVRLFEDTPQLNLRGMDLRFNGESVRTSGGAVNSSANAVEWQIRCQKNGRDRGEEILATRGGRDSQTLRFSGPLTISSKAGFFQVRGRPYREELRIYSKHERCQVINVVDLEKYLSGLVNAEFSSKWSEESVEAQVVAARSYAYYQIRKTRHGNFDVDATVNDQVYDGSIREDARSARIVERTRGLVLMAEKGHTLEPLKAFYHSTCAGRTELPERVWGNAAPGFRRQVSCPFCASSPVIHWDLDLNRETVEARFRVHALSEVRGEAGASWAGALGWSPQWISVLRRGRLVGLRIGNWDSTGRVQKIYTEWAVSGAGSSVGQRFELAVTGAKFREWMGAARFRSTAFLISPGAGYGWHFKGRGNGHGVGMCQYGAKVMGERGYRMASILKYYYPDALIRKLW